MKESSLSLWLLFLKCSWLMGERSHGHPSGERCGGEARGEAGPLLRAGARQ